MDKPEPLTQEERGTLDRLSLKRLRWEEYQRYYACVASNHLGNELTYRSDGVVTCNSCDTELTVDDLKRMAEEFNENNPMHWMHVHDDGSLSVDYWGEKP